jgi:hypothetical protein
LQWVAVAAVQIMALTILEKMVVRVVEEPIQHNLQNLPHQVGQGILAREIPVLPRTQELVKEHLYMVAAAVALVLRERLEHFKVMAETVMRGLMVRIMPAGVEVAQIIIMHLLLPAPVV